MANEPAPKKGESSGWVTKVVASIIAPIVVAVGIQWANKLHTPDKPDVSAGPAKEAAAKDAGPTEGAPKVPVFGVIDLITPNLAEHFYQYAWNEEAKKDVRSEVIDPNLVRYEEKSGRIFVVGNGRRQAVLTTKADYQDYTLNIWY
jgi:hypothetical protein